MGNLIKPSDYARKMGISRQAVYAKIKRGILTSRSVDGKLYIVQGDEMPPEDPPDNSEPQSVNAHSHRSRFDKGFRELLAAKDETIGVLKETIVDLKETNKMITSTLRSEVDLLKEAFSEMKLLYTTQIEHLRIEERSPQNPSEAEKTDTFLEEEEGGETLFPEAEVVGDELAWIELSDLFDELGIRKKTRQNTIIKRLKKLYKKGDSRIDMFNGELVVLADADYTGLIKKKQKK